MKFESTHDQTRALLRVARVRSHVRTRAEMKRDEIVIKVKHNFIAFITGLIKFSKFDAVQSTMLEAETGIVSYGERGFAAIDPRGGASGTSSTCGAASGVSGLNSTVCSSFVADAVADTTLYGV
jgi:hypothetical protein